jgi:DNA/RNA-binding domain of Phe-tRNA-synthetase-like protein
MIAVAPELHEVICPGALAFEGLTVVARDSRMDSALHGAERQLRAGADSGLEQTVAAVRAMYRKVGIDPTKTRPSSEALLRRVRKGDSLPRINSLVDVCNWCSAELQLPYGLYDLDRIASPVELRLGRDGEEYAGIRKDIVHVAGRPTLVDAQGPFGNPTSDSARTMVTTDTRRALILIFAPRAVGQKPIEAALNLTSARVAEFTGGREISRSAGR